MTENFIICSVRLSSYYEDVVTWNWTHIVARVPEAINFGGHILINLNLNIHMELASGYHIGQTGIDLGRCMYDLAWVPLHNPFSQCPRQTSLINHSKLFPLSLDIITSPKEDKMSEQNYMFQDSSFLSSKKPIQICLIKKKKEGI